MVSAPFDSFPVPVVEFCLVPRSTGDWKAHGARFGKVSSKKETIFGYKLHLLITLNDLINVFELAPANAPDLKVGEELLASHANLDVSGDKADISAKVAASLPRQNGIKLATLPRRNQKQQVPEAIERAYAHSFRGLCAPLIHSVTDIDGRRVDKVVATPQEAPDGEREANGIKGFNETEVDEAREGIRIGVYRSKTVLTARGSGCCSGDS